MCDKENAELARLGVDFRLQIPLVDHLLVLRYKATSRDATG
jgi:hypothetical protein